MVKDGQTLNRLREEINKNDNNNNTIKGMLLD